MGTSSLCPTTLRGGISIAVKGRIRTTVYIEDDLFVRGRGDGLNFSEIMNLALAAVYGIEYGKEKELLKERVAGMQETVKDRIDGEKGVREAAVAEEERKERAVRERQESITVAVSRVLKGGALQTAYRRLPEFDRYGDHIDYWEELAASVSRVAGFAVDVSEITDYVRKHGGNRNE